MARLLTPGLFVLCATLTTVPLRAQVPDTTAIQVATANGTWVGLREPARGLAVVDTLPPRLPALILTELLSHVPASFTYLFGTHGWPDGWSPWGLPPRSFSLAFSEIPFTHVFTGRPALDLVPLAFIEAPHIDAGRFGHPVSIHTRLRAFDAPRPLTEGRYWKGGDGLQSIDVVHVQNRRRSAFGRPGFLRLMGAYSGRTATGEYPGGSLSRGRQLHLRATYEQQDWSLEVLNAHNRRRVGAHGGVIPVDTYETIYIRTGAEVENPEAERRLIRNDLSATFRFRLHDDPTSLAAFWTAETFRYRDFDDTLATESDRLGLRVRQPLFSSLTHEVSAHVEGWIDRVSLADERHSRSVLHAYLVDSLGIRGWSGSVSAGAHLYDGGLHPGVSTVLTRMFGRFQVSTSVVAAGQPSSTIDATGFGKLRGLGEVSAGMVTHARTAVGYRGGIFDASLGAFLTRMDEPVDYYAVGDDSAAVLQAGSKFVRAGAYMDAGWRRDADRGFYLTLQPSLVRFLNPDHSPLHRRSAESLPSLFGRARFGMRYLLFRGDLDLDLYAEGLAWSVFRSRTLEPQSGLLTVPLENSREFGPSGTINLVLEAGIREAKVFLVYENVLSGTALMSGNLIVPDYPLPARRFRVGVFWPIMD
ncbi:MAG: hypothetical protein WD275_04630 [Rhodothermales bacterium]